MERYFGQDDLDIYSDSSSGDEYDTCVNCGSTISEGVCSQCGTALVSECKTEYELRDTAKRTRQCCSPQRTIEQFLKTCKEIHRNENYNMPDQVLDAVAKRYMEISETLSKGFGTGAGRKEVVRRGNRRREVIAALLYFELIRANYAMKRENIAAFLDLRTNGFSRGENIVRRLNALGLFELPSEDMLAEAHVRMYFDALGIVDNNSFEFILALIEATDKRHACANSCLASKVVGAIWLTFKKLGRPVSARDIEKVNSIKKATFMKYADYVESRLAVYEGLFIAYGIPTDEISPEKGIKLAHDDSGGEISAGGDIEPPRK